ncbi:uncharacterized protein LOC108094265 [Drosophila ficusphila]|uniref:uncharacterized protein LOC108094265 n=1 Tax=Drosophila ficusphila TaxID=30025 RepID=UPI0007E6470D|nr:uncharacterized protein LOC108094265 [Drosophila ficusphila]
MRRTLKSTINTLAKVDGLSDEGGSHTSIHNCVMSPDEGQQNASNYLAAQTLEDLLNEVLQDENFQLKPSSSSVDPFRPAIQKSHKKVCLEGDEDLDMDPRLRNWNRILEQRRRIQERIEQHTGKRAEDVLFNRSATIDEASKRMILRVLDSADRSRPLVRLKENATLDSLKPRRDPDLCRDIHELYVAKPQMQQVEFVGLPQVTQKELASTEVPPTAVESQWQRSKVLDQRLEAKKEFIQQVLEFAPDLQKLQVTPAVGERVTKSPPVTRIDDGESLQFTGDSTSEEEEDADLLDLLSYGGEEEAPPEVEPEKVGKKGGQGELQIQDLDDPQDTNALMVNGMLLDYRNLSGSPGKTINMMLKCDPYERSVKVLLDIQNLSPKLVHVYWLSKNRLRSDRMTLHSELIFDRTEFILEPQGRRVIRVMFQPEIVGLFTQRWNVCFARSPFCGTRRLDVIIQGQCTIPALFQRRLEAHQKLLVDKQQKLQAKVLIKLHAGLAPIIENPPLLCPYTRIFDEREVFNAQNFSYRCERYEDLEALKDLYALAKKPRDRPWDLTIESLRTFIGKQESRLLRESLHNQLVELLQPMKCNSCSPFAILDNKSERDKARFIYVRGTISSTIDEWEAMAWGLDEQFFKLELLRRLGEHPSLPRSGGVSPRKGLRRLSESSEEQDIVETISKTVRSCKYLKDSLYMHTYDLLCNAVEDIVSVIESTAD